MQPKFTWHNRWQMALSAPVATTCTNANTYYKVVGTRWDGCSKNFTISDADDKITNTWWSWCFHFSGNSEVAVDKACDITYWLYRNWELVTWAETVHTFTWWARTHSISISKLIDIVNGDYFQVYVKTNDVWVIVTHTTLVIVFIWVS